MKQLVYDIKEMSDSKEVYGQRPNPFFAGFIYTVLGLLAVALIYCCFGKIEIVSTSSGIIRPNENISSVSSLQSGQVTMVNYYDGKAVKTGDVLFAVDTAQLQIQLDGLKKTQQDYAWQIEMINRYLAGMESGENPFSGDLGSEEYAYHVQFAQFSLQLTNAKNGFTYDVEQTNANIHALNGRISKIKKQITGWSSYKTSVMQESNMAQEYPEYEKMYLLYEANMQTLKSDYETQKKQLELTADPEQLASKLSDLEAAYLTAMRQEHYQTVIQIDTNIQALQSELDSATASLKQYQIADKMYDSSLDKSGGIQAVSLAVTEQTALMLNQRDTVQNNLDELELQILQLEQQIEQGSATAQCDGTVSVVQVLAVGDVVSAGTVVATIIPSKENIYKVQLYVNNADIANVESVDAVKYNIAALPSSQYGIANGVVTNVSTDTTIQNGQYSGYYLVECTIETETLRDSDGNVGSVSTGMQVEAKIITQEKTILHYLLEKINLF